MDRFHMQKEIDGTTRHMHDVHPAAVAEWRESGWEVVREDSRELGAGDPAGTQPGDDAAALPPAPPPAPAKPARPRAITTEES